MSESELIMMLAKGDQHAFDRIYAIYARRLMSYCLTYVRNQDDAEEMIQDIFVSLWKHREGVRNTDTVGPYLYMSLRKSILCYYRSRLNTPLFEDYVESGLGFSTEEPQIKMEYDDFVKRILRAMDGLPLTQRNTILLSKFYGLTNAEISGRLNLSMQTVKNSLSSGLKRLRERLGDVEKLPMGVLLILDLFL